MAILKICDVCRKPIAYIDDNHQTKCACETPTNAWTCDEEIYPLLKTLWDKGYTTDFSCSGHPILIYVGDDNTPYVKIGIDSGIYISIATPVKVKELEKWKYGSAYIRLEDGAEMTIRDIEQFVDLPDGWKFNPNDPIIKPYMDMVGKEQAENLRNWVNDKTCRPHYVIRCDYRDNSAEPYINKYMALLEDRHDMAKLISILPNNE